MTNRAKEIRRRRRAYKKRRSESANLGRSGGVTGMTRMEHLISSLQESLSWSRPKSPFEPERWRGELHW